MNSIREKPILFSAPMVRAILEGQKTQTRRVVKPQPCSLGDVIPYAQCPYGVPGDRLRVKEAAWMWCERVPNGTTKTGRLKWHYVPMREAPIHYAADHPKKPAINVVSPETGNEWGWRLKIGRFLPAWASRITPEETGVRVERLQDISEADAIAEGIERHVNGHWKDYRDPTGRQWHEAPSDSFCSLWESINGAGSWDANPWVWVLSFRRIYR